MALSLGLETSCYLALTLIAGFLGAQAVAAFQAGMSLLNIVFMLTIGLGVATSVRVANAVGRGDPANLRRAAWVGAFLSIVAMVAASLVLIIWPAELAGLFTRDAATNAVIRVSLLVAAFYLVLEGWQMVRKMALRGLGDIWVPFAIALGAFWLAGVPAAAVFAMLLGWGTPGIFGGIGIAMLLSAFGNTLRFRAVSRRRIARL
jgi:MATE family multidrug resistance protein